MKYTGPAPFKIYVDADACPVKEEIYRVATRYRATVYLVSNQMLSPPLRDGLVAKSIKVGMALDAADDWIVDHIGRGDLCITADLPLTARVIDLGGLTCSPRGHVHDARSISEALASRDLMTALREQNAGRGDGQLGGPAPMNQKARSAFLNGLDRIAQRSLRIKRSK